MDGAIPGQAVLSFIGKLIEYEQESEPVNSTPLWSLIS